MLVVLELVIFVLFAERPGLLQEDFVLVDEVLLGDAGGDRGFLKCFDFFAYSRNGAEGCRCLGL